MTLKWPKNDPKFTWVGHENDIESKMTWVGHENDTKMTPNILCPM